MSTSIFIRSWRGDREWLNYCLRSIKKHASGFEETVVVIPKGDDIHFGKVDFHGARVEWCDSPCADDYDSQQVSKLMADTYCRSSRILFLDSDCFAYAPFCPQDFESQGKPVQLIRHWSQVGDAAMWRDITKKALGVEPSFEHMAVLPLYYEAHTLALLREHIAAVHGFSVEHYVKTQPRRQFSEFNLLGAFALRHTPHLYDWREANPATDGYPRTITQRWSWQEGGVERHREEYEGVLA